VGEEGVDVARSGEFRASATRRVGGRLPLEDGDLADEIWSQTVTLDFSWDESCWTDNFFRAEDFFLFATCQSPKKCFSCIFLFKRCN
jgi:hypothetical protein